MKDKIIKLLDDWKVNKHKQELMAEELLILSGVSQQRELLIAFYANQNGGLNDTNKHSVEREVDNFLSNL